MEGWRWRALCDGWKVSYREEGRIMKHTTQGVCWVRRVGNGREVVSGI